MAVGNEELRQRRSEFLNALGKLGKAGTQSELSALLGPNVKNSFAELSTALELDGLIEEVPDSEPVQFKLTASGTAEFQRLEADPPPNSSGGGRADFG